MQTAMAPLNPPQDNTRGAGVVVVSMPEIPQDYFMWSIFNFVYMNYCCLGLFALFHSIKSRDRRMLGDMAGARMSGSKARCFNIISVSLALSSTVIGIIVVIVVTVSASAAASAAASDYYRY